MRTETLEIARKMVADYLQWRKEQAQKQWEKESLEEYERSKSGHGDHNVEQGKSV